MSASPVLPPGQGAAQQVGGGMPRVNRGHGSCTTDRPTLASTRPGTLVGYPSRWLRPSPSAPSALSVLSEAMKHHGGRDVPSTHMLDV
jgi:hypothetical protein